MKILLPIAIMLLCIFSGCAETSVQETLLSEEEARTEILQKLDRFMEGASRGDAEIHGSFWHEELVYTSSSGARFGKAALMAGLQPLPADTPAEVRYHAENPNLRFYAGTALLDFTLVAVEGESETRFLNSGVLIMSEGSWQVVNWQATRAGIDN
ncbi:MAG: nuclear transport factor 2 family protein [Balneolales bacterium]|nr:nuclear transport factor 2 family protein [Balneolales bacterium]